MNLSIENKLQQIYDEKQTKLIPSNIKMGEEILGIRGNYTKDATATASNILNGYTAYANGSKLTGTMPNNGTLNYTPTLQVQNIPAGYTTGGTINAVTSSIDSNITTENIRSGVTILGVNGDVNVVNTYIETNAAGADNIAWYKYAYVNGQLINGRLSSAGDFVMAQPINYVNQVFTFNNKIQTRANISGSRRLIITEGVTRVYQNIPNNVLAEALSLYSNRLKVGVNILDIEGNVIESNTTNLDVTLSTSIQSITPNSPYNGFNIVNIPAVTSNIDPNIISDNIKNGVTILGVNGKSTIVDTEPQSTTTDPTYTSEGETEFILDSETGYYEYSGKRKSGSLAMSFTTDLETDLILSYKGGGLLGDASVYVSLDSIYIDDLLDSNVYTTFTIPNVSAGSHVVEVNIPSMFGTTTLSVKMLPIEISEPMITTNTVFDGHVGYINGQKIIGNYIPLDTSDANATSGDIVNNMTAYVNGQKVVGNYNPINTSDATALVTDIANGKTAYVNGQKITGTLKNVSSIWGSNIEYKHSGGEPVVRISGITSQQGVGIIQNNVNFITYIDASIAQNQLGVNPNIILEGNDIIGVTGNAKELKGTNLDVTLSNINQSITPQSPYNAFTVVNIPAVTASIDNNITAANIKSGIKVLNITGNFTSDATAKVNEIISGKTAYVNGQKLVGTLNTTALYSTNAITVKNIANNSIRFSAGTPANVTVFNAGSTLLISSSYGQIANAINLQADQIKSGENILGVVGNVDSIKEYNSVNNMRNDSSAVANHSYGIELRSMNSTTYVDINYDSNRNNTSGFNRLNIVNSFTRSSTLDKSHYIGPINYSGDYDIYNSHISINSTNAYITIIGLNNECLLDAQYTSLDGNTYNISSLTGSCVQNNQFYYNVINLCTLRMMGEWVPLYDNTVFNCFLKPMEVQNITVEYPAALYKYDGTNWNKLMDKDDNITTINTTINCNLPNLNNV